MQMNIMTPTEIKRAIDDAGYTQAALARDLNVTPQHLGMVVNGLAANHRVRCHIAKAINVPVKKIWRIKKNPTRTGRPLSKGLCDAAA